MITDIYHYLDYQAWLAVVFKQKKAENPAFSHRYVSQRLGLKSSGYILYVMQGKRKLTEKLAIRLAQILKITKQETDYFLQSIRYTHATTSEEKQFHFQRLISLRRKHVKNIGPEQYRFYEKWYYPVVREVLALVPFTGDCEELSTMIIPPVKAADITEAINLLSDLDLIVRDVDGRYYKKEAVISTGDMWHSAVIHAHQRDLIERGRDALDNIPKAQRDISHVTITASQETFDLIAQRIAHVRSEILELARQEKNPDRVLQCSFIVFPTASKKAGQ